MRRVINTFLVWRILLFLPVLAGGYFIVQRFGYNFYNPWANFDGVHYLSIAQGGYITQAAFFPLYPLLIKLFSFGKEFFLSGFLVSNIAFVISLYFFYKLLVLDYTRKRSWEIITFLLLFPTAFFFASVYSESLFFLLLILSFYSARKEKWFWAIVFACLLAATRLIGILILPALVYEYYIQKKKFNFGLFVIPLGLTAYSFFNYSKWGDPLYFINAHGELANSRTVNSIVLFPQTMVRYFKILLSLPATQFEWWIVLLELSVFIGVLLLLYLAWKKKVRISYLIFSLLAFALPASSGTFSGLPRYALVLFPIYIALSYLNSGVKKIYLVVSALILAILLMFFSRGYFVA